MLDAILSRLAVPSMELLRTTAARRPRRAPVMEVSPADAQSFVNFVVLVPRIEGEEGLSGTLRAEAAHKENYDLVDPPWTNETTASTCSFRFEWQPDPQLRVRFFYFFFITLEPRVECTTIYEP